MVKASRSTWGLGRAIGVAAATSILPTTAIALTSSFGPLPFATLGEGTTELQVHPFSGDAVRLGPRGLSLFESGQVDLDEAVRSVIGARLGHPAVAIKGQTSAGGLGLVEPAQGPLSYRLEVRGVPLCDYEVKAHRLADQKAFIIGRVPKLVATDNGPLATDWPDPELARYAARRDLRQSTGSSNVVAGPGRKCLHVQAGHLLPVWDFVVQVDDLTYRVLADGYEVLAAEPRFFDATATARAYQFNKLSGKSSSWQLADLNADSTLTNSFLTTVVPSTYQRALASGGVFDFPDSDPRFDEVQAFVHANLHFEWFKSLGFKWYGPQPLQIKIHFKPNGSSNNALFTPGADGVSLPSIQIDDGDGIVLQNLISDGDVVSHEFGHHVIFNTLRSTEGESLVLHEGLADTFVFFRTGDACLGESICPQGSTACILPNKCLRSGETSVAYNDTTWQSWGGGSGRLGHLHGQLISGLMWDLRKSGAIGATDLQALLFKAISYFHETSGFKDFLLSLLIANRELFQCKYDGALRSAFNSRGLSGFLAGVDQGCSSIPDLAGQGKVTDSSQSTAVASGGSSGTDRKGGSPLKCGVEPRHAAGSATPAEWLVLIFALAAPAFAPWARRAAVKIRARRQAPRVKP